MRLKIVLQYSNFKTDNIILFWKPEQTVEQLCDYLEKNCSINSPQILVGGFRALNDQIVQNVLSENEIIQAVENFGSSPKKDKKAIKSNIKQQQFLETNNIQQSQSEDCKSPIKKPETSHKAQLAITQNQQKLKKLVARPEYLKKAIPPIENKKAIIQVAQSETESSSEDVVIKKPNQSNKLNISQKSPEEELKVKQAEWKKTFTKGMQESSKKPLQPSLSVKVHSSAINLLADNSISSLKVSKHQDQSNQIKQTTSIFLNEYVKISVQTLKEEASILEKDDEILFKYVYLDLIKCEPTVSSQMSGRVFENNSQEKKITIMSKEKLIISYSELQDLEINVSKVSEARKAMIKALSTEPQQIIQNSQYIQKKNDIGDTIIQVEQNKKEVIDPFGIGQQINYYYSDKNYNKDDFILQHSAQDPEKCIMLYNLDMNFKLLLNFPKIKSKVKTVEDLFDIVELFLSKTNQDLVNFQIKQISDGNWVIRKKIQ